MGDKKEIFKSCLKLIQSRIGEIRKRSSIFETEPWGFESDDLFWNQAILVKTSLKPTEVLERTQQIEQELGRIRKQEQYVSRLIDIDLLFYDEQVIRTSTLQIPHPLMAERRFVLAPLAEIAGEEVHPVLKKTNQSLLEECPDQLEVKKLNFNILDES